MVRQSTTEGPVLLAGNFLLACVLLTGCVETGTQPEPISSSEEKNGEVQAVYKQEIEPFEEEAVKGMDIRKEREEVSSDRIRKQLITRLQKEQWEMVNLQLKEAAEINVPSDDFKEPQIAHAVLDKQDVSRDYAWLEINEVNRKFNAIWQKHWGKISDESEKLDEDSLIVHLTSIQRRYESLLNQIRHMEFKNSTQYAQHLHDYKLYLEGAVQYRIEAVSALLEAMEKRQQVDMLMQEAVDAAIDSEAYARLSDAELTSYQWSFQIERIWNPE